MMVLSQLILCFLFLVLAVLSFTLIGVFILKKIKLDFGDGIENYVVSTILGMVLFTLAAYVLAVLNLRSLMWTIPILGFFFLIQHRKKLSFNLNISHKTLFLSVFLIGIIGQVAVNAPSGFEYKEGIYFWSSHGHDGIWHLALMDQMKKNIFPFQNPELAGQRLQNYHFFVDLLMSEFSRLFNFSNLDIYFRFMPVVFSVLLGLCSFIFVRYWSKSEVAGIWAAFFTYFVGSFGYLVYIPTHKSLGGESIFWVSQTQSVLGNPPHAAAFIILATFLFCLLRYLETRRFGLFVICALLGSLVIEFKVYAGALLLFGLLFLGLYEMLKKSYMVILLFLVTLAITLFIYVPNSANSQDFLIWQPWWFIRTMVVASDRLNWIDLELKRQTYIAEENWKRVIQVEATALLIFLFGNLGMRVLGFWSVIKQLRENIFKNSFNLFFLCISFTSFFIPLFFLQKGVAWNSIQFNQYFLLLFGFLAAVSVTEILGKIKQKAIRIIVILIIILLSIPTQIGLLLQFYGNKPLSKISYEEIEALNYLGGVGDSDDIVLVAPFNKYERDKYLNPPIPIYAWYDTGYVSAFSGKQTLISDEEQVDIMGYDVEEISRDRADAFNSKDPITVNAFLKNYSIDFVYLAWNQNFAVGTYMLDIDPVFENNHARVYKVRK